jgi:iron complex transport system ATP-binding protein
MVVLTADRISFSYDKTQVIDDISLSIDQGEFVGIIGPNGAGKSTLLRLFCRILVPDTGTIHLFGENIRIMKNRIQAQRMAFVPQETHFSLNFTVEDIVRMGRFPYLEPFQKITKHDIEGINNALTLTQTDSFRSRPILSLSSGERQRVVLARALAQQPDILLLDEPSSHLDILHQQGIMESLRTLHSDGTTIVIVHHDLNLASLYCQRLVVLHEGRVFTQGSPNEIVTRDTIQTVYKTEVDIIKHPRARVPQVILKTGGRSA